ncbi:MAG: phosphotransferase [Roseovarius sp.]
MAKKRGPSPLPDMDAMMDLVQAFETLAATDVRLAGARLDEVIRLVPGKRAILSGTVGERPAIFRFYIEHAEANAQRDWAELQRVTGHMSEGDFRVNAPALHVPELGLVVVDRVDGTPLMERIRATEGPQRSDYLRPAARWLRAYTAPTEEQTDVRLDGWYKRIDRGMARQRDATLRRAEQSVLAELHRIAAPHEAGQWRIAISHGDFHPNNLLSDGARLTGIDTGGSAKLPIYKDMARFLSHMARRDLIPSGEERFGVDARGLDAFAEAFTLDEVERNIWLPFMLGVEVLIRIEAKDLSARRIRKADAFYGTLLDGLRKIRP